MITPALEELYTHSLGDKCQSDDDSHLKQCAHFPATTLGKLTGLTASAAEVAAALGLSEKSFRRRARRMHRDHGFPAPLRGGSWTWSVRAVAGWIEATGSVAAEPEAASPGTAAEEGEQEAMGKAIVLEQHRRLRERYGSRS